MHAIEMFKFSNLQKLLDICLITGFARFGTICAISKCHCNFTESNTHPWCFSLFLNCTNGTKSRKASQISIAT